MATKKNGAQSPKASTNGGVTIRIPVLDAHLTLPGPPKLAYYAGLGAMAAFEFIDWPVALVIAAGHEVATRTRNPEIQQAAEGTESGA
ncbi:MAG: hypothetical protein JO086_11385 [Acidimicrobiia bacterium]|nr:hypothetical protein [Acidimicrobiia bacterium]